MKRDVPACQQLVNLGLQVKSARKTRRFTLREVAELAGVTTGVVWKIEQGLPVLWGNLERVTAAIGLEVTVAVSKAAA